MAEVEYGFRLARIAPLDPDGGVPDAPEWKVLTGVQQAQIQIQISQGQSQESRGDDKLLTQIEEGDEEVGANITLQVAVDALETKAALLGGTYTPGPPPKWTPRAMGTPQPRFALELWAARYSEGSQHSSDVVGFRRYFFPNCTATGPDQTLQDRNFKTPSYTIKARDNKTDGLRYTEVTDEAALPA